MECGAGWRREMFHRARLGVRAIVDAIQNSRVMVLIFSDNANTSGQIAREVELRRELRRNHRSDSSGGCRSRPVACSIFFQTFTGSMRFLHPWNGGSRRSPRRLNPCWPGKHGRHRAPAGQLRSDLQPTGVTPDRRDRTSGGSCLDRASRRSCAVAVIWRPWLHSSRPENLAGATSPAPEVPGRSHRRPGFGREDGPM